VSLVNSETAILMKVTEREWLAAHGADDQSASRFEALRAAFAAAPYPSYAQRREALRRLRAALRKHAQACAEAATADFGVRATAETMLVDLLPSLLHIDHLLRHLRRWMRPSRRSPAARSGFRSPITAFT